MRKICLIVLLLFGCSTFSLAQTKESIEVLCKNAITASLNNNFSVAKGYFDQVLSIISKKPNSDLMLGIPDELAEYIIINQAKVNIEEVQQCATLLMELQMQCLSYCATQGYFQTKEDYVNNISSVAMGMGFTLADAGLLKDAEDCINAAISVYQQTGVNTKEYLNAYEQLGYFHSEYCQDYISELKCKYEGFKVSTTLYGLDAEITKQIFGRLCMSYAFNFAFLAYVDESGVRFQLNNVRQVSYESLIDLANFWDQCRTEIISSNGVEQFQGLLNMNPINLNGDPRIRFGTQEWDLFYKSLAALHYNRVDDYDVYNQELLKTIQDEDDLISYSRDIVSSLRNHNQVNRAFDLYNQVAVKVADRRDLVEYVQDMAGELAFAYGFYDKAWSYVVDLKSSPDSVVCHNKETLLRRISLLGSLYRIEGNYQKNLEVNLKAVEMADADSLSVSVDLRKMLYNNLAVSYSDNNYDSLALEAISRAIDLGRRMAIDSGNNPDNPKDLLWPVTEYGNLADYYIASGELEKAQKILKDCLTFYKYNYPTSPRLKQVYYNLMYVAETAKDYESMKKWAAESYYQSLSSYLSQSHGMTKIQRTDYWQKMEASSLEIFSQFALNDDSFADLAYNVALIQKGFLLKYDTIIIDNIVASNDPVLMQSYNDFKKAESAGSSGKYALEERVMELYSKHPEFVRDVSFVTWKDVQKNLTKGDMAVEFVKSCSDGKTVNYSALLLQPGWEKPIIVKLSSEKEMDAWLAKGSRAYLDNDRFYSMTWGHIEPFLNGVKRIYFSPYGVLAQLNVEILQNGKGKPMNKTYDMYRVSSTTDICNDIADTYISATLFGGLNYDLDTDAMEAVSRGYAGGTWFTNSSVDFASQSTRKGWSYLPGTKKEVEKIGGILDKESIENVKIMADSGTEESFKALSGRSTPILHVATHGFYISEKQAERSNTSLLKKDEGDSHIYPLRRCGLMMSGGQHAWLGESIPDGIDDGILTAEEIAGLNLSGTDLLVLSACQTGLGEIGGDGVYGLQRGFKIAGVNTIIMSLWEVSDTATEVLMTKFYGLLTKGKSKREAFDAAVEAVKKLYPSPEYWAAFIMLD